jgi:hypothetical protein
MAVSARLGAGRVISQSSHASAWVQGACILVCACERPFGRMLLAEPRGCSLHVAPSCSKRPGPIHTASIYYYCACRVQLFQNAHLKEAEGLTAASCLLPPTLPVPSDFGASYDDSLMARWVKIGQVGSGCSR